MPRATDRFRVAPAIVLELALALARPALPSLGARHDPLRVDPLPVDTGAHVPWWRTPDTDLHTLLVHMAVETARHAGHLDILREQLDGARGLRADWSNVPDVDEAWWEAYVMKLRGIAERSYGG